MSRGSKVSCAVLQGAKIWPRISPARVQHDFLALRIEETPKRGKGVQLTIFSSPCNAPGTAGCFSCPLDRCDESQRSWPHREYRHDSSRPSPPCCKFEAWS